MMVRKYNIRFAALLLIFSSFPTLAVRQRDDVDESVFRRPLEEAGKSKSSTNSESRRYVIRFKRGSKAYSDRFEYAADQYHDGTSSIADVSHLKNGVRKSQFGHSKSSKKGNPVGRVKENKKFHSLLTFGRFLPRDHTEIMYLSSEDAKKYEEMNDVEYVELDRKRYLMNETIPYGIHKVGALSIPDTAVSNRKVCIVDTGFDMVHPDLSSDPNVVTGYTGNTSAGVWSLDGIGHGTHVAGTIAALGGNNQGVAGVNRNGELKLHIVKVFDENGVWAWGSTLIAALEVCVDAGANVVNMSLGGGGFMESENNAYKRTFEENNVLIVAAAGNAGNTKYSYPASYDFVMSVAATDSNNEIAMFSQKNDQVDISAPGVNILSTIPTKLNVETSGYALKSGTSMATPHVTGVAALIWSAHPTKSAAEIRSALEDSALDLGIQGRDNAYGHGLVRADLAVAYLNSSFSYSLTTATPMACTNSPEEWHDSDGPGFDCEWYSGKLNCERFGDIYTNFGKTANEACCTCGGGCTNSPEDWYDSDGPVYTCEWYALNDSYCAWYGNYFENFGKTAKEACCSCGGGAKNAFTSANYTNRPGSNKELPSSSTFSQDSMKISSTKPPSFMSNSKPNSTRNPSVGTSSTKPPIFMANLRPNSSRKPSNT